MIIRGILVAVLLWATTGVADAKRHTETNTSHGWGGYHSSGSALVRVPHPVHAHHKASYQRLQHHVRGHLQTRHRTSVPILSRQSGDLVTVPTAAGISITVARKLAPQFQGFVADLVQMGYTPKHIGCWASGGHVPNSNHYHGGACDFDQTGWNRTSSTMYHIGTLAAKWGLRDGCTFRRPDCGHVDDGTNIGWKHPNNLIAKYIDFQTSPVSRETQVRRPTPLVLEPFEE